MLNREQSHDPWCCQPIPHNLRVRFDPGAGRCGAKNQPAAGRHQGNDDLLVALEDRIGHPDPLDLVEQQPAARRDLGEPTGDDRIRIGKMSQQ